MSENITKYLHKEMDKEAGIQHAFHRTKIVATVGPSCDTYDKLLELVKAGVNVFRLNFSHGSHEDKARIIEYIKLMNQKEPYNIAILADLQGPKLRVGDLEGGSLEIATGDILTFTSKEKVVGTKEKIYVSYPDLHADVKVGDKFCINSNKEENKTCVEIYKVYPTLNNEKKLNAEAFGVDLKVGNFGDGSIIKGN